MSSIEVTPRRVRCSITGAVARPAVRPPQVGRNVRVALGESFDVEFINHGLVPGNPGRRIASPGEGGVDHSILGHSGGIVAPVKRQVLLLVPDPISEMCESLQRMAP